MWGVAVMGIGWLSSVDPITAIFTRDWSAVGGWSLLVALGIIIIVGAFRELWVPGRRARRTEALLADAMKIIQQQADQITKLTEGNELTKYVIGQVIPSRQSPHAPHEEAT